MKLFVNTKIVNVINIITVGIIFSIFIWTIFASSSKDANYGFDVGSIYDWGEGWAISLGDGSNENVSLPYKTDFSQGRTVILKKTLPNKIKKYNCLMFVSNHQDIIVNVGGVLRYSYSDKETRRFGISSPNSVVLVPIYNTDEGEDVSILISSDSIIQGKVGKIFLGNEQSIILAMVKRNMLPLALCIILMILFIAGLVCFVGYRNTMYESNSFLYLALFSLLSSVWCFMHLEIRQMFVGDIHRIENTGYLSYILLPVMVASFLNWTLRTKKKYHLLASLGLVALNFLSQCILQFNNIYDFYELRLVSDTIFVIMTLAFIAEVVAILIKSKVKNLIYIIAALIILFLSINCDMVNIIRGLDIKVGNVFAIGLFSFVVINMLYLVINVNKEEKKRKNAESANEAKSQFLATMSHEIRTPINAVLGMNEIIMRETSEDHIKEYAGNIEDAGKSLLSLVNDILDFSKIEAGKMDIICCEYSMKSLLCDLVLMIKGRMQAKDLKLNLNIDENIPSKYYGDEVRLRQILTNLLTNSAKYTREGSVTFTVANRGIKDDEIELFFSVKDTGIGIKKEDIEKLLNSSFIRVDSAKNKNIEGTGLGISITRQLLNLMGTKLEIYSNYGEGSEFCFVIKQKVVDATAMGSVIKKVERNKKREVSFMAPDAKILAVDDTKTNLTVIKGLVKPYKLHIDTCDCGEACIEMCKASSYDIIFMDHMMPGMDGIETLKALNMNDEVDLSGTKIIALTANAITGAEEMYMENGFDGYLTKPIDVSELDECIRKNLREELIKV